VTNRLKLRKEAVARLLNRRSVAVIDTTSKLLIDGLGKSYVYRKLRATSTPGVAYADEAEKGRTSHVIEAFQYLCTHVARVAVDDEGKSVAWRGRLRKRRVV
jgi:hypothetical protein